MVSNKSFNGDGENPCNSSQSSPVLEAQLIYLINNHVIGMLSHVCKLWPPSETLLLNPTLIKRNKSTCYFHLLNHGNCWKAWPILRGTFDSNETVKCKAPLWIRLIMTTYAEVISTLPQSPLTTQALHIRLSFIFYTIFFYIHIHIPLSRNFINYFEKRLCVRRRTLSHSDIQ